MKKPASLIAVAMLPILSLSTAPSAMAQEEQICNRSTARQAANAQDYQALCDCGVVTTGFLSTLQSRRDFGDVLQATSELCPLLAGLLSDVAVAAVDDGPDYENDISEDGTGGGDDDGDDDGGNDDAPDDDGGTDDDGGNDDGGNDDGGDDEDDEPCTFDC